MAKSLKRARELLSREDLIGFDTSEWAAAAAPRKQSGAGIRSSAAKVGGKAGIKAGPARS
jgi:hypothetical protein